MRLLILIAILQFKILSSLNLLYILWCLIDMLSKYNSISCLLVVLPNFNHNLARLTIVWTIALEWIFQIFIQSLNVLRLYLHVLMIKLLNFLIYLLLNIKLKIINLHSSHFYLVNSLHRTIGLANRSFTPSFAF